VAHGFQLEETNVGLPLKHNMFPFQFALGPSLPMHGNPHWVTLKRVMHL
jgi:hypothetical protein